MKTATLCLFFLSGLNLCFAQFPNVMIGNQHAPEEVSICINPKNPLQVVAGANIDNYYYSSDGGLHWTSGTLVSTGNGVYGDPCLFADTTGTFYFIHLSNPPTGMGSWVDRIVCHRSSDGGITYNNGTYTGKNGTKVQDKAWTAVNPFNNEIYVCWTQFDVYGVNTPTDSTIILFSKSTDNAATWSNPKRISAQGGDCMDSDSTVEGAVPCVGPNGQIYVAWAGAQGLVFNKSLDGGITWMPRESQVCLIPGGWDYNVSGLYRCNGLPVTTCDMSNGPNRGTIYINWSDQRNGTTDTDIWMVKSTDGGITWSSPKRVNTDPPGRQNFMSFMTIDQSNGDLYVVYYDRRNYSSGDSTDVFLARSSDGGNTFTDYRINENA
ncbi:MAG TPA: sialidase family protein, partial [Bacteroidia bacterium]|nr:sialidase family protein [Bacteroidia bacterium]